MSDETPGHFITFEGGEGAGKSTQVKRLAERLQAMGHRVLVTREPGGTPSAEAIRHIVLSGAAKSFGVDMEAVLFAAARADNVRNIIKPALSDGKIVLCDRYMDSSRVYQGVCGGVDQDFLATMERAVTEGARPGLTLIFDLSPKEGLNRASATWQGEGPDRYESVALEEQEKRRQGFLDIAKAEPQRCVVIDAARSLDDVSAAVDKAVDAFLSLSETPIAEPA